MQKRFLGKNHLTVSAIGLGCWGMSNAYGPADLHEARATLEMALDCGITFWDTADVYGNGHNERLIAAVVKKNRARLVVATKFGFVGDEHGKVAVDGSPGHVHRACEQSLKRLETDFIDLYYLHRRDPKVPIEETIGAMAELVRQGKVRFIGLSEVSAETLRRAHSVHPVTALQSEYSLWHRDIEGDIWAACRELRVSVVPFSPLGRGYLTGTLATNGELAPDDYRRDMPRFQPEIMARNQTLVDQLRSLAGASGHTPSQLCLAWLLRKADDVVPIPGMKRRSHLQENAAAAEIHLTPEQASALDAIGLEVWGDRHNPHNLQFVDR